MLLLPDDSHIARLAADLDDLRIGDDGRVVRVHEDVAEAARERLVLGGVELLVAEEDDAVIEEEVEFVFEITSSLMKHVVRLNRRQPL